MQMAGFFLFCLPNRFSNIICHLKTLVLLFRFRINWIEFGVVFEYFYFTTSSCICNIVSVTSSDEQEENLFIFSKQFFLQFCLQCDKELWFITRCTQAHFLSFLRLFVCVCPLLLLLLLLLKPPNEVNQGGRQTTKYECAMQFTGDSNFYAFVSSSSSCCFCPARSYTAVIW